MPTPKITCLAFLHEYMLNSYIHPFKVVTHTTSCLEYCLKQKIVSTCNSMIMTGNTTMPYTNIQEHTERAFLSPSSTGMRTLVLVGGKKGLGTRLFSTLHWNPISCTALPSRECFLILPFSGSSKHHRRTACSFPKYFHQVQTSLMEASPPPPTDIPSIPSRRTTI